MAGNSCLECGANFDTETELTAHRRISHGSGKGSEEDLSKEMEWEGGPGRNSMSESEDTMRESREEPGWNPDEPELGDEEGHPARRDPRLGEH